eukprot:c19404_g1_i1.p1 GENE.c19404_g1_i1~~c19404_g1_i1.p1  ORF type:complete len:553 (+),score=152.07 c19404_g1_i1:69-1727(+)
MHEFLSLKKGGLNREIVNNNNNDNDTQKFRLIAVWNLRLWNSNILRVEDILKRSFQEAAKQKRLPDQKELVSLSKLRESSTVTTECLLGEPDMQNYFKNFCDFERGHVQMSAKLLGNVSSLMKTGRLVVVQTSRYGWCLGYLLRTAQSSHGTRGAAINSQMYRILAVTPSRIKSQLPVNSIYGSMASLLADIVTHEGNKGMLGIDDEISQSGETRGWTGEVIVREDTVAQTRYMILDVNIIGIRYICTDSVNLDLRKLESGSAAAVAEVIDHANKYMLAAPVRPKILDYQTDLKIKALDFIELLEQQRMLEVLLESSKCSTCVQFETQFQTFANSEKLSRRLRAVEYALSDQSLHLLPEFIARVSVLEHLKYIDTNRTVMLKGRVACEIVCVDELIATELIFDNAFTDLAPEEIAALISCLLCQEKDDNDPYLIDSLKQGIERIKMRAEELGELQFEHGLPIDPKEEAAKINPSLVEVVYEWAKGRPFSDIVLLTNVPEGSIVRTITRVQIACGGFKNAARVIGNTTLFQKMEIAAQSLKRDIVFAASLYVQ